MKWLDSKPRPLFPLRWKLLIYFLVFLLIMAFVGIYANLGSKLSTTLFGNILYENRQLEEMDQRLTGLRYYSDRYLADRDYESLERYFISNAELRQSLEWARKFQYALAGEERRYLYVDLINSVESVIDLSEKVVDAKRNGQADLFYQLNQELMSSMDVLHKYLVGMMNQNMVLGNRQYEEVVVRTARIEFITYLLALAIAALGIIFVIQFTLGITQPLYQIIDNAEVMAAGNFRVGEIKVDTNDELQIIANVFNRMASSIRDLFQKTEEKVMLERQLKEEKMRNLETTSLLREAELKALQSQVNPHFLYNTLNAISQVAIIEGADETAELTKTVANLFRYNLRKLDQPATIRDEINNVEQYLQLMKVRYGDQLESEIVVAQNLDDYLIPGLTLQPLVENAIIHGLAGAGRKGKISISVKEEGELLLILIRDNGVGMDQELIDRLVSAGRNSVQTTPAMDDLEMDGLTKGYTTGLGFRNIVSRLRFFCGREDVVRISSRPGEGTTVELRLPLRKEGDSGVQLADCG